MSTTYDETASERLRFISRAAAAHSRIVALTTLAAELQTAAATLTAAPVDGPCDDTCACTADAATALIAI